LVGIGCHFYQCLRRPPLQPPRANAPQTHFHARSVGGLSGGFASELTFLGPLRASEAAQ